jgi:hypothetical protein
MRVLDATLAQEPMSLPDGGDLAPFHGLLQYFEGFFSDQLLAAAFSSTLLFSSSSKPPSV